MVKVDFPPFGPMRRVTIKVDGTTVGEVVKYPPRNGWSGERTRYSFVPNEAGKALALDAPVKHREVTRYADLRALLRDHLNSVLPPRLQ